MRIRITYIPVFILIAGICCLLVSFRNRNTYTPMLDNKEFINKIFNAVDNVKTLKYSLQVTERIKGKIVHNQSKVKLQVSPRKLYLFIKGIEILWIQGANNGEALVNPGSFPFMDLNLDPYGSLMRKDQHHTINEVGYNYLADILKDGMRKVGDKLDQYFTVAGEENYDGKACYKLIVSFPDFAWNSYTALPAENFVSVARKFHVSEYMLLENNPKHSGYYDLKAGQIIKVPNAYAKLTILLIDKETLLPLKNEVFDDKGLFEMYEYKDLQVNPAIAPEEFTKTYKGYHF